MARQATSIPGSEHSQSSTAIGFKNSRSIVIISHKLQKTTEDFGKRQIGTNCGFCGRRQQTLFFGTRKLGSFSGRVMHNFSNN